MSFARKQRRKAARAMVNSKIGKEGAAALAKLCITGEAADRMVTKTIAEERLAIRGDTFNEAMIMALWVLHTKFGYGQKRLQRFCEEVTETAECLGGRYVKMDELRKALEDECGIVVAA